MAQGRGCITRQAVIISRGAWKHDVIVAHEGCSPQYGVLLFTASITLIRIDGIMYQHSPKYFYVRGRKGLGISRIVDECTPSQSSQIWVFIRIISAKSTAAWQTPRPLIWSKRDKKKGGTGSRLGVQAKNRFASRNLPSHESHSMEVTCNQHPLL